MPSLNLNINFRAYFQNHGWDVYKMLTHKYWWLGNLNTKIDSSAQNLSKVIIRHFGKQAEFKETNVFRQKINTSAPWSRIMLLNCMTSIFIKNFNNGNKLDIFVASLSQVIKPV